MKNIALYTGKMKLTPVNSEQLNCENRKLKYLSMSSRPCLDELLPSISDCIALDADSDADTADGSPDNFAQYQQQVKGKKEMCYSCSYNTRWKVQVCSIPLVPTAC